ncbi:MAG: 1-deoxy-D-xylulose-5-phosphate reductoisomerase [Phycisphaerales bacterium]|nr:1-deoxy-D-xylulose-5-phosphate reductoisomerase [Phycisphaerales bacterium]
MLTNRTIQQQLKTINSSKNIAVFGSTGSIGKQTLEIVKKYSNLFKVTVLVANNNHQLLIEQALFFKPEFVVVANESLKELVTNALAHTRIKVLSGAPGMRHAIIHGDFDTMVMAIVGFAGLVPTIEAISRNKKIALANKEVLVVGGHIIKELLQHSTAHIIPVDSEHSAIFQCLMGEETSKISKVILTSSGGPFRGKKQNFLQNVRKQHALAHPNWSMGAKISIDSATMMNKGFEVIEAKWLFDLMPNQIEIIIHPEQIVHSFVEFEDGSVKAQLGMPDMKIPIQFALTYPSRIPCDVKFLNFQELRELKFEEVDTKTFKSVDLSYFAVNKLGNAPCVLNAANEVAVAAFIEEKIQFLNIVEKIEWALETIPFIENPTLEDIIETDKLTRSLVEESI